MFIRDLSISKEISDREIHQERSNDSRPEPRFPRLSSPGEIRLATPPFFSAHQRLYRRNIERGLVCATFRQFTIFSFGAWRTSKDNLLLMKLRNVVLIITDDMGYADVPGFGVSKEIPMPAIERLSAEGVAFTNAYVSAPICVPSRMGIYTGRHQVRWGACTNEYKGAAFEGWQREKTMAQYFKEAGYVTGLVGKWHLTGNGNIMAYPDHHLPDAKGWDEIEIIPGGMAQYFDTPLYLGNRREGRAAEYATDHFGKRAVRFIEEHKEEPFLLSLAFNCPHAPLHSEDADVAAFGGLAGYDRSRYQNQEVPHNGLREEDRDPPMDRQVYAGMCRAMDRNVGRVLDALDAHGLAEETLVIFINDNGGPSLESEVHSYNQASNAPYRGHKFDVWEGGIRVPMIVRWPGALPAGLRYPGLSSGMDILPTMFAATGLSPEVPTPLDGVNLLPHLTGGEPGDPHASLAWYVYFYNREKTQAGLRKGPWKIHQTCPLEAGPTEGGWALYHVEEDPGETKDLALSQPDLVKELGEEWQAWKQGMIV